MISLTEFPQDSPLFMFYDIPIKKKTVAKV